MSLLAVAGTNSAVAGGYQIDNSLKFEADNTEYLVRTPSSTTNRKTWTFSAWVKRTELGTLNCVISGGNNLDVTGVTIVQFFTDDTLNFYTHSNQLTTTRIFRDTSAWYHIVWAVDSTQSTAADRVNIYINGEEITDLTGNYPVQNWESAFNYTAYKTEIGRYSYQGDRYYNGYISEVYLIDGQQLAASDFGEFDEDTGIWKPKAYTGSYGTNGFYLDFEDSGSLGADDSGNGNNFTLNNITSADQATDTPTNNFATFNPLIPSADMSFSNGATDVTSTAAGWDTAFGSIGVSTGKWYFEYLITATDGTQMGGVADEADIYTLYSGKYVGESANSVGYYGNDGIVRINGSTVATYNTYQQIPTMSIALDLDNGKVYFRRYDTWQGSSDPVNGTNGITLPTGGTGTWFFAQSSYYSGSLCKTNHGGFTTNVNIAGYTDENGYGNFAFEPPSGYYALCSKNLAEFG